MIRDFTSRLESWEILNGSLRTSIDAAEQIMKFVWEGQMQKVLKAIVQVVNTESHISPCGAFEDFKATFRKVSLERCKIAAETKVTWMFPAP